MNIFRHLADEAGLISSFADGRNVLEGAQRIVRGLSLAADLEEACWDWINNNKGTDQIVEALHCAKELVQ